jgi:hypothetical protein
MNQPPPFPAAPLERHAGRRGFWLTVFCVSLAGVLLPISCGILHATKTVTSTSSTIGTGGFRVETIHLTGAMLPFTVPLTVISVALVVLSLIRLSKTPRV